MRLGYIQEGNAIYVKKKSLSAYLKVKKKEALAVESLINNKYNKGYAKAINDILEFLDGVGKT